MLESQKEKLLNNNSKYISIGITVGGEPVGAIAVPWESTANAFNMRTPNVYLAPEDLNDKEIISRLDEYKVIGCYIWAPLEDYGFLSRFKDLEDIHIKNGDAIRSLDFLSTLQECRMFYLQNAKLKNLDIIVDIKKKRDAIFGGVVCIGLDNCEIEEISVFEREEVYFSEFLIFKPEGTNEAERWNRVSAGTFRYYEFKE